VNRMRLPMGQEWSPGMSETKWDPKTKTFRISHVTPGTYLLTASVQDNGQDPRNQVEAFADVTVEDADIAGLRLEPAEHGMDGTVRWDADTADASPVPGPGPRTVFISVASSRFGNGAPVDAEGKFHVGNLMPTSYRIAAQISDQKWCVRSILAGGRDVRDGLTIPIEGAPPPVEVSLTKSCGSITGTVAPSSELPPNVSAYLFRKAGDDLVMEKQVFIAARPGDTPHFTMQGITPGDYILYAWPNDAQIEYSNPEYMRQFESYGQPVTVAADEKASVTIDKILSIPAKN